MQKTFRFLKWSGKRAVAFLILTVVLCIAVIGSTLAYIMQRTEPIVNEFVPPVLDISISGNGNTMTNTGDIPVYVRAAIVVTWVSESDPNTVLALEPVEGDDYTIELEDSWFVGSDGFYYYESSLGNSASAVLIDRVLQHKEKVGYKLSVQVVSSAIQAMPADAVNESWTAVKVSGDGKLTNS